MTQTLNDTKISLLSWSTKQIRNIILNQKQSNIKNHYFTKLNSTHISTLQMTIKKLDSLDQSENNLSLPLVNNKFKDQLLNKYFNLQKDITGDLLVRGKGINNPKLKIMFKINEK